MNSNFWEFCALNSRPDWRRVRNISCSCVVCDERVRRSWNRSFKSHSMKLRCPKSISGVSAKTNGLMLSPPIPLRLYTLPYWSNPPFITARAYARAVLGVVILSVRPSHAWIVTKLNNALQIFLYHTKGQPLCYSATKSGWSATPPSLWNLRSKTHPPSKNADFDRFPLITSQP